MPQDKYDCAHVYAKEVLQKYEKDLIELVGPQHEGCYRVKILTRKIKELTVKFNELIDEHSI